MPEQLDLRRGPVTIDGGLGTLLEERGHDVSGALWSGRLIDTAPDAVRRAHESFFTAGASLAISGSYQISYEGFEKAGLDREATDRILRRSVSLAAEARDSAAPHGLVAASVGPYGAMLADGSEYRGDYGLSVDELRRWHRPRLDVLADTGADLLAFETIPCLAEAEALIDLVAGTGRRAWLAITASLGRLRSGESLERAFALTRGVDEITAVGINCSHPAEVLAAIAAARSSTDAPVVVYPNGGEEWDTKNRVWIGDAGFPDEVVETWLDAGASIVGGCCRVGPEQIRAVDGVLARRRRGAAAEV